MVLTPKFHFSQTYSHLFIYISIPQSRLSGLELTILNQQDFSFYCRPYLLRLDLPGLVYDEEEIEIERRPKPTFDSDQQVLTICFVKVNEGETFQGLDFLTTLNKVAAVKPRVGKGRLGGLGSPIENGYGFTQAYLEFFGPDGFLEEYPELVDIPQPDETSQEMRRTLRILHEDTVFSPKRYRIDLFYGIDDDMYSLMDQFEPEWKNRRIKKNEDFKDLSLLLNDNNDNISFVFGNDQSLKGNSTIFEFGQKPVQQQDKDKTDPFFNQEERLQMSNLINKELPELPKGYINIVDVCLAFCYENRACQADFTVESHWTMRKLSASLNEWDLCQKAALDCVSLISDKRWILRILLKIQSLFSNSSSLYLLNRLYIDDMCLWIQKPNIYFPSQEIQEELVKTFDNTAKFPGSELVGGWNLSRASSFREVDDATLSTSHLKNQRIENVPKLANERDYLNELD